MPLHETYADFYSTEEIERLRVFLCNRRKWTFSWILQIWFALSKEIRYAEVGAQLEELVESLSEADGEYQVLNNANDKFSVKETKGFRTVKTAKTIVPDLAINISKNCFNSLESLQALSQSFLSDPEYWESFSLSGPDEIKDSENLHYT